ncbi:tripartite tricarboxylate transporter substrate binding protein [Paenibacillus sp.]|uniref:Bug family tripartite tricarboxylate transporter substrate binding protein n=1 Tax=Paenibacillus sp. TaxID=58172 RepID=UPI002D59ED3A|nr:tripartite tricarboxylate transporter substrate binding protein [Paenibacillus sp.]HZG85408.1 tripartite tricarboxylate transporter substrate binding protein [Paenibacillus sp.]
MRRNAIVALLVVTLLAMVGCSQATNGSSSYPSGDLTFLVPYPAGGVNDIVTRQVAQMGKEYFNHPAVVLNRPGASGTLGTTEYMQEKANSHKLLLASRSIFVTVPLVQDVQYAFADIEPVIGIDNVEFIVYTNPKKTGIDSVEKLIEYGKSNTIKYGSAGPGSDLHLIQAGLFAMAGVKAEAVVFGGGGEAINNVAAGHIDVAVGPPGAGLTLIKEGSIVPIAVAGPAAYTGFEGMTVPTLKETGYDISYPGLNFFAMKAGTDAANIQFMYDQIAKIYETEAFKEVVNNTKLDLKPIGPDEIKQYIAEQQATAEKLHELIEKSGQ